MMFKETPLGFEYQNHNFVAFFGKHNSTMQNLNIAYPYLSWSWAKQVHGNRLLQAPNPTQEEADALWTQTKGLGLITKTADCMPVLAFNKFSQTAVSIHAGWRGVALNIVPKAFQELQNKNMKVQDWEVFIGPHILQKSFHIKDDSCSLLRASTKLHDNDWLIRTPEGYQADLFQVVTHQLKEIGLEKSQIHSLLLDTHTDMRLHSYRRDKENSGRQISFIALLDI